MNNKSITLTTLIVFLLAACNNNKAEKPVAPSEIANYNAHARLSASAGGGVSTPSANQSLNEDKQSEQKNTNGPALNPQHGQPGHRCDLAVGAPLAAAEPVKINGSVTKNTASSSVEPIASKPALNPQHGQPGHRCDLAVGAPLNTPEPKQ